MGALKITLTVNFFSRCLHEQKKQIVEIFIATWFQFNAHKQWVDYGSIKWRVPVYRASR